MDLRRLVIAALAGAATLACAPTPEARAGLVFQIGASDSQQGIYSFPDTLTGTPVKLVDNPSVPDRQPSLSPDGSKLAYESTVDGTWDIWVTAADGSNPVKVGSGPSVDGLPSFGHDNDTVAFQSVRDGGYDIWLGKLSAPAEATKLPANCTGGSNSDPDLHPTQPKIVWQMTGCDGVTSNQLIVADLTTGTRTQLTFADSNSEAKWSPDGSMIAWRKGGSYGDIWVMNADGSEPRALVTGTSFIDDRAPAWSPDSSRVVFVSDRVGGDHDIYSVPVAGGLTVTHTSDLTQQGGLDWVGTTSHTPAALTVADVTAIEGSLAVFTLQLDRPALGGERVVVSTEGPGLGGSAATANADYTPVAETVVDFLPGESSRTVSVPLGSDEEVEGEELFVLKVSETVGFALADGTGVATITDEDSLPGVSVGDVSVTEGGVATFSVTLSGPAPAGSSVQLTTVAGTAAADADYTPRTNTILFETGQTAPVPIAVQTLQDGDDEPAETFTLQLQSPNGVVIDDGAAAATVLDDDEPAVAPRPEQTAEPSPSPPPAPAPGEPEPETDETVVAKPVSGRILVRLPGSSTFVDLAEIKEIPNGTVIDARKGRVEIRAAGGGLAVFYAGIFKVSQSSGLTTLALQGEVGPCGKARGKRASVAAKRRKRRLWGSGKGRFRTAGRYASATVRGTTWMVEDSCSGTLTRDTQGSVTVRDSVTRRTLTVKKGRRYLARPRARR